METRSSFFRNCLPLLLLFLYSSIGFADIEKKGYQVIENKALTPLLNPSLAQRQVAKVVLDNGLQIYLISDPDADQSAAGMCVEVGSWQDPKEYPGMAHFLEHMLFMGTAAYPKEFEYMQFINDHGGSVNASTWPDRTLYMFSINNDAFEPALDRFAHFFIDPLFLPSCISRELRNVDQEHAKNIENDGWRQYMIFKETGNAAHPNAGFSTGNAQTLSGIPQDALKTWYQEHYNASGMHLVVISPLPLEQLLSLAVQDFSQVPNRKVAIETAYPPMISENQIGHIIYVKPIKDLKTLSLMWEVPPAFAHDVENKAAELIAYALGNGSESSLLELLKKEKLAEALKVSQDQYGKNQALFSIDIQLTQGGLSQIDTVIMRCFEALAVLKAQGIPGYLFDEMQRMAKINYQYQSREEAFHFIMEQARTLMDEDLATFPEKTSIPSTFDPSYISSLLNSLTAQTCTIFVLADPAKTGIAPDATEKWMGAEYAIRQIPEAKILAWNNASPHSQIALPPPNSFLPTHLALVSQPHEKQPLSPKLIANDPLSKIYFAQDTEYLVPEVAAIFSFKSPLINGTARAQGLTDLYIKALSEKLSSTLFFAETAGLEPSFAQGDFKFQFAVQGYSEKAPLLVTEIFKTLKTIAPSKEQFEIYKQSLLSSYENASKELPVRQASELLSSIIFNDAPTQVDKFKALKEITYDDFITFARNLFKTSFIEGLLYGNVEEREAIALWTNIKTHFSTTAYPIASQFKKQVLLLPEKHGPYMIVKQTPRQGNGTVLLLQEGPFSFEKRASQQVIAKALQESFFDTLRTKQQTGYIAKAWDTEIERQLLQFFAVQSSTHHPSELIARFELFLEDFVKFLPETLSPERFETIRQMLVITLQMPPENLQAMAVRLNALAFDYEGDFGWYEKRIESAQALTYDQMLEDAHEFLSRDNPRRLAVLIEGVVSPGSDFHYESVSKEDICDLGTFVSWK